MAEGSECKEKQYCPPFSNRDGEFRKLQITIQTDTLHVWIYRYS